MLLSIDCLATMEHIRTRLQRMGLGCSSTDLIQFCATTPRMSPTESGGGYTACFPGFWYSLPSSWAGYSRRTWQGRVQRKSLHPTKQFGTYANTGLHVAQPVNWFVHTVGKLSRRVELPGRRHVIRIRACAHVSPFAVVSFF